MTYYLSSDYDSIQSNVVSFASNVMYDVGFNVASTRLQIVRYLKTYNILNLFLGLIINVIICILLFISTLLVYSLLVTNVESRTFEIGTNFRRFLCIIERNYSHVWHETC